MNKLTSKLRNVFFGFLLIMGLVIVGMGTYSSNKTQSKTLTTDVSDDCSSTYKLRVFHDGYWWIQIYCTDSDRLLNEYLDPVQC